VVGVKRGDIWLVDLNPVRGSEQRGVRPCLVISNNVTNEHAPTVCVVPLTSNLAGRRFPINVLLMREDTGLKRDSLCWVVRYGRWLKSGCCGDYRLCVVNECQTSKWP